jgi:hypothetical protein
MIAAFLFISCEGQFSLKQTLWPPSADDTGLFGRSVSFSAQRIVVGASMFQSPGRIQHNGNQTGAVYPYTYDAEKDCFFPSPGTSASPFRIDPSKSPDIVPGTFGSKVQISLDGTALIVGAPYTDVSTTYRDFVINDTDFDPSTDIVNYTDPEGISQSFYSEIGAIYLFMLQNDGSWIQDRVSVPATIVYRGGYGRSLAGNDNLRTFAGAYFNKIRPGSSIPQKVGKVFVESRTDFGLRQYPVIDPPPPITNKSTQRFGSVLSLFDDKTLFVVSQAIAGSVSAVYIYER